MKRLARVSRHQLTLFPKHEATYPLPEEAHEALVTALADLLLEALGHEPADQREDRDEP